MKGQVSVEVACKAGFRAKEEIVGKKIEQIEAVEGSEPIQGECGTLKPWGAFEYGEGVTINMSDEDAPGGGRFKGFQSYRIDVRATVPFQGGGAGKAIALAKAVVEKELQAACDNVAGRAGTKLR